MTKTMVTRHEFNKGKIVIGIVKTFFYLKYHKKGLLNDKINFVVSAFKV